jgi:transposase
VNVLTVNEQQAIRTLADRGWSRRRIARELGLHRETVSRYLGPITPTSSAGQEPKPAILPPGSSDSAPAIPPPGCDEPKPAILPAGSVAGRRSACEPFRAFIEAGLAQGLSAQRLYQDLRSEHGFAGGYDAVKRFVRALGASMPLPFRRMEMAPGEEVQVDYGQGAWVIEPDGTRYRPHLLRLVLSASRKGYTEAFRRQTTESFIRGMENGFRAFGGVTATVVIDNLKAAVKRVDWFDPDINPKVRDFAEHYGTVFLPTRPAMPRHKGKVEAGVKYAQANALRGRKFTSLGAQNDFLLEWERTIADTRIHGTTRKQVAVLFAEVEAPALRALPASLFPVFEEGRRTVHRDGYVEIQRAFYSVPPEYLGHELWVRWEARLVRIFDAQMNMIALHTRHDPGAFSTDPAHIHTHKRRIIERGADWLLDRASQVGQATGGWARAMYAQRGPAGIRVLQGLLSMVQDHAPGKIERACARALEFGAWRLRDLRALLDAQPPQTQFHFVAEHPLIRPLADYAALSPDCFHDPDLSQNV